MKFLSWLTGEVQGVEKVRPKDTRTPEQNTAVMIDELVKVYQKGETSRGAMRRMCEACVCDSTPKTHYHKVDYVARQLGGSVNIARPEIDWIED